MARFIQVNGAGAAGAAGSGSTPASLSISFLGGGGGVTTPYGAALTALGGVYPYTYSISIGTLPGGLSLNTGTGAITGTPTTAGTSTFTGKVVDSASTSATVVCTIVITGAAAVPYQVALTEIGPRTLDLTNQSTHTTMQAVVEETISLGSALGTQLHVQFSSDNGATWGYDQIVASDRVHMDGTSTYWQTTVSVGGALVWVQTTATNWKARAWALNSFVDLGPGIASANCAVSSAYSVALIGPPSATGATLSVSGYTLLPADPTSGAQQWQQTVTIQTAGAADPSCWQYQLTGFGCNTSGTGYPSAGGYPAATETLIAGIPNDGNSHSITVTGGYFPIGWTYNSDRFKVYGISRSANPSYSPNLFNDPTYSVAQKWPSTLTYNIQTFGPPGSTPGVLQVGFAVGLPQVGIPYSSAVSVANGKGPYTYAVTSGAFPSGVSLLTSGVVSGTPLFYSTTAITITVTDSLGSTGTISVTFTVTTALNPVGTAQITSVSAAVSFLTVNTDSSFSAQIAVTPTWSANLGVQSVTLFLFYRRSALFNTPSWYWQEYTTMFVSTSSPATVYINVQVAVGASFTAYVAVAPGQINGDASTALGTVGTTVPVTGAILSNSFSLGAVTPGSGAVTGAVASAARNFVDADGAQDWEIPSVTVPMPGSGSPNTYYISLTGYAVNSSGAAAPTADGGVEVEIDRFYNLPQAYTAICNTINSWGYQPRTAATFHYLRLQLYSVNRNGIGWNDVSGNATKQAAPWTGLGTPNNDVNFGVAPPGVLDPTRQDPSLLNGSVGTNSAGTYGTTSQGSEMFSNPTFDSEDASGNPLGWYIGPAASVNTNPTYTKTSPNSILLAASGGAAPRFYPGTPGVPLTSGTVGLFPCNPGDQLVASAWIISDGSASGILSGIFYYYNASGGFVGQSAAWTISAPSGGVWTPFQGPIITIPSISGLAFCLAVPAWVNAGAAAGNWYVDNVSCQRAASASNTSLGSGLKGGTNSAGQPAVVLAYGAALTDDGTGKATILVNVGSALYTTTLGLNMYVASDFVVSGSPPTLNVASINLAKSVGFDVTGLSGGSTFSTASGYLALTALALNRLVAGTALFTASATFANSSSNNAVVIGSAGVTLCDNYASPTTTVTVTSGGIVITKGSNTVQVNASAVSIFSSSMSLTATSSGIAITGTNASVSVSASLIQLIYSGVGGMSIASTGISMSAGSCTLTINASSINFSNGSSSVVISASSVAISNGSFAVSDGTNTLTISKTISTAFGTITGIYFFTSGNNIVMYPGTIYIGGPSGTSGAYLNLNATNMQIRSGSSIWAATTSSMTMSGLPSSNPGAGSKQFYYNPGTNAVFYAP